jgi:hypothetical protein
LDAVALVMPAAGGTADRLWDLETGEVAPRADAVEIEGVLERALGAERSARSSVTYPAFRDRRRRWWAGQASSSPDVPETSARLGEDR